MMLAKQENFLRLRKIGNSNCCECNIKENIVPKRRGKEKFQAIGDWTVNLSPFKTGLKD